MNFGVHTAKIAINLNPYQGLKQKSISSLVIQYNIAINLNPYQGLKPIINNRSDRTHIILQST